MAQFIKVIILLLLTIILLINIAWFLLDIQKKSVQNDIEMITTDIDADTEIGTNQQGIAHITSDGDNGMFFAMGYFHASQRLWSMCHWRNIASGRVAEFYGEQYIHCDIFMRALNLNKIAKDIYNSANDETKSVLTAYAKGINEYITKNKHSLSVEFMSTNTVPNNGHPSDCFLLWRFGGFLLSNNFHLDLTMSNITKRLQSKGFELLPNVPASSPCILDDTIKSVLDNNFIKPISVESTYFDSQQNYGNSNGYDNIVKTLKDVYLLIGKKSGNIGASTWAVKKSEGDILLLNETYSSLGLPSYGMQMHISSPSYNVVGMTIPGIPVFYAGKNDYIAGGQASLNVDDVDFFIHKFKDKNNIEYLKSDSIYVKLIDIVDTINVKGKDSYLYYKNMIDGCSVISDKMFAKNQHSNSMNNNYLTFKGTGQIMSNEIEALIKVMQAKNWNEFLAVTDNWNNPGTVFSYADINGNIGVVPRAFIPVRSQNFNPIIANPYGKHNVGWQRIIKSNELPKSYNPGKQFVVASNNMLLNNVTQSQYISSSYAIDSRVKRLIEMLNAGDNYHYRYAQYIQNDVVSVYAREIGQSIRSVFVKYKQLLNAEELKAFYKLEKWNYAMSTNSTSATIFSMFIAKLVEKTFKDELNDLYYMYIFNNNIPLMKLKELLLDPYSAWFDDVSTSDKTEYLDFMIISSFKSAMLELNELYNTTNSDQWQYGKFHTINFEPIFNYHLLTKNITTLRHASVGGGIGTINCHDGNLDKPFSITSSYSMRFIADMSNNTCYTTISTGVSGDIVSQHYSDQIQLGNIGASIPVPMKIKPSQQFKLFLKINKNSYHKNHAKYN